MIIEVNQDDIDNGKKCNSNYCPIACAVRRAIPNSEYISMSAWGLRINNKYVMLDDETDEKLANFVLHFDAGNKVEPIKFELEIELDK